jgi:hypothetical protein
MDLLVTKAEKGQSWLLRDLLGRMSGKVVQEAERFTIVPAGPALATMRTMRLHGYSSLDEALMAIETHTRGVCRREELDE